MNLDGFDANEVNPNSTSVLPAGKYKVVISESGEKETKSGNGSYLALTLTVVEGEHEGRKLFERLNLNNPNDIAAGIARAKLSQICRAVGVLKPVDSSELHDIPLFASVVVKPPKDQYDESNEVKKYEPAVATTGVTTPSKPAGVPAVRGGDTAAPWAARKK